ncbi:MAG: hypothetical protein GX357_09170 [Firmicutes bacterium]|nr:hypothetical protein [Bacillota bacterium]
MDKTLTLTLSVFDEENIRKIKRFYAKAAKGRSWQIKIDPSILGGFIITDRDQLLDYSAKGQLEQLRLALLQETSMVGAKK